MNDFYEGRMIPLKIADQAIINCNKEIEKLQIENDRLKALTVEMDKTINISQSGCRELKAEVERLTSWQPIETLPMFQEALIVCEGLNGIYFGARYKSGVDSSQVDIEKYKPTQWMPLPVAPAKEGNQS